MALWRNGCADHTVMAAFCSQVYSQADTIYLLPGEDRRYINEKAAEDASQKREGSPAVFVYRLFRGLWVVLIYGNLLPHQRYLRRVGTRTLILIGFAIWSFIPASSATCLSSEKAFAVIAMMGIFAFWDSSIRRIFFAAS